MKSLLHLCVVLVVLASCAVQHVQLIFWELPGQFTSQLRNASACHQRACDMLATQAWDKSPSRVRNSHAVSLIPSLCHRCTISSLMTAESIMPNLSRALGAAEL